VTFFVAALPSAQSATLTLDPPDDVDDVDDDVAVPELLLLLLLEQPARVANTTMTPTVTTADCLFWIVVVLNTRSLSVWLDFGLKTQGVTS
jgi:predicted RNA-binding protein (virulence factor B family)